MPDWLSTDQMLVIAETYGVPMVGAILVLIIGWTLSSVIANGFARLLARTGRIDETLRLFFRSLMKYLILAITIIAVLEMFGVKTTSLVAVLGAASLAIGLALQGTLQDLAAGVMLMIFRPFRVGEFVEAGGQTGTIKEINLFITEMATPDNLQITIPNSKMWGSAVKNFSRYPTRRVDLVFGISYDDDIGKAMDVIREVAQADDRGLAEPALFMAVTTLNNSSVDITTRVWCNSSDFFGLKTDLTRNVKEAFDKAGITIPYPHMQVVTQAKAGETA